MEQILAFIKQKKIQIGFIAGAVLLMISLMAFIIIGQKEERALEVSQTEEVGNGIEIEESEELGQTEVVETEVENELDESELDESETEELDQTEVDGNNNIEEPNDKEDILREPQVKVQDYEIKAQDTGIDVSHFQGHIDWSKVKADGIDFAIVRIGNRNTVSGEIEEDPTARYNLQEATAQGIPVGAYFFSSATNESEILDEVAFVKDIIDDYTITYPVVYNCENFQNVDSRQYELTVEERSTLADMFLSEMEDAGYVGMFYASKSELQNNTLWNTDMLEYKYRIWVAQYSGEMPEVTSYQADYYDPYEMWQYTDQGLVSGIEGTVDMNISYFGYSQIEEVKNVEGTVQVDRNPEVGVQFEQVQDVVTPKELVNVRSTMDQGNDDNIIGSIENGIQVVRTGIGVNGWSRILYNEESSYVLSNYVTTDLSYKLPTLEPNSGFNTQFSAVSEQVTAKEKVNLRNRPSVESPSEVIISLTNGEVATRTGIAGEGWSRVEYLGQTLYCISSYLQVVE